MLSSANEVDAERVLATVTYGCAEPAAPISPLGGVPLPVLSDAQIAHAVWKVGGSIKEGVKGRVRYRHNDHVLLGSLAADEAEFPGSPGMTSLRRLTQAAYAEIFGAIDDAGFPNLVRCWNYLPRINEEEQGLERYRHFNIGRKDAFDDADRTSLTKAPSACALGTSGGRVLINFIASQREPLAIENPRQVSAYHYPSRYGPRSPTFSRATVLSIPGTQALFISGTASIVGHESVHIGDVVAQAEETLRNLDAVVAQANLHAQGCQFSTRSLCLKIFLRDGSDREAVVKVVRKTLGESVDTTWLQADICRADLLVEMEGFGFCHVDAARR